MEKIKRLNGREGEKIRIRQEANSIIFLSHKEKPKKI